MKKIPFKEFVIITNNYNEKCKVLAIGHYEVVWYYCKNCKHFTLEPLPANEKCSFELGYGQAEYAFHIQRDCLPF